MSVAISSIVPISSRLRLSGGSTPSCGASMALSLRARARTAQTG
jgi:hypothetical protein